MADEIQVLAGTGLTMYAMVRRVDGPVWYVAGQAFEAYSNAGHDADDYDIPLSNFSVGYYVGDFDANIPAGTYIVNIYEQLGGTPADTDLPRGTGIIFWSGSVELVTNITSDGNAITTTSGRIDSANVTFWAGNAVSFTAAPNMNVSHWGGSVATKSSDNKPDVNIFSISDDDVAANNMELFFDGTGYNAANSTIGTVTTNTDLVTAASVVSTLKASTGWTNEGSRTFAGVILLIGARVAADVTLAAGVYTVADIDGGADVMSYTVSSTGVVQNVTIL